MKKAVIIGWVITVAGMALWLYGYLAAGHPPIVNWQAHTPWWIADYLPNVESELGVVLTFVGMVSIYWPSLRQ